MAKAFQVVARDIFVPTDQKEDAFLDHPLPLDHDFNISAPRALSNQLTLTVVVAACGCAM